MTTVGAGWRREDRCTPAEKRLVRQVEKGQLADFLGSDAVPGVMGMQAWGPDRTIRAAVIRRLLVDDRPSATAKSVTIRGAKIRGILDLEDAKPRCPLRLDSCYFADSGGLMLDRARIPLLSITRCWLASLSGEGLAVLGTLDLSYSEIACAVSLPGAQITGSLLCLGSSLGHDADHNSFVGNEMTVQGSVRLSEGFKAAGAVRLTQAVIFGSLYLRTACLGSNKDGNGLSARALRVGGDVYLDKEVTAKGALWLGGADISGQMVCSGSQLGKNSYDDSLWGDGIRVGRDLRLDDVHAAGAIRLNRAVISGQLFCSDGRFGANKSKRALSADEIVVRSHVRAPRLAAAGAVRFVRADILGHLDCEAAQLDGKDDDGDALLFSGMRVGGSVLLKGISTCGSVLLIHADITGQLRCDGAQLGMSNYGTSLLVRQPPIAS